MAGASPPIVVTKKMSPDTTRYSWRATFPPGRRDWRLPEGRGIGELGEKGEGIKKYKLVVTKYRGGKHSIGNIVNDIVITVYGTRQVLDLLIKYDNVCRLGYTPEVNIILNVSANKKFFKN